SRVDARASVERLGLFALGAGLPAAVDPEVLAGVGADEVLDPLRVALRDVAERVVLALPLLGVDDVLHADLELELPVGPAGVADDDGDLVVHREEPDRL